MILYVNGCSMTAGEELGGEIFKNNGEKLSDIDWEYKFNH